MDVVVFRLEYADWDPKEYQNSPETFAARSKGRRVAVVPERMPLKDAVSGKLAFAGDHTILDTYGAESTWNTRYDPTLCPSYMYNTGRYQYSYRGPESGTEHYRTPAVWNMDIDDRDKGRELPAVRSLSAIQLCGDTSLAETSQEAMLQLLPYSYPLLNRRRILSKNGANGRRPSQNLINREWYADSINRRGLIKSNAGLENSNILGNDYCPFSCDRTTDSSSTSELPLCEIAGSEISPLVALSSVLNVRTNHRSVQYRAGTMEAVRELMSESVWDSCASVVPTIDDEFLVARITEFCERARDKDQQMWARILNVITCCIGSLERGGGSHYQIGKAGAYKIKPSLKGKIKRRSDFHDRIYGNNCAASQIFTVKEVVSADTLPIWFSMLFNSTRTDYYTANSGITHGEVAQVTDSFHERFNYATESLIESYVTNLNGKRYVGYGNALASFMSDNGVKFGATVHNMVPGSILPVSLFVNPGLHENWDANVFQSLRKIYELETANHGYPSNMSDDLLATHGTLSFFGEYNVETDIFTLTPNLHHVSPNPKMFTTESMDILRDSIKTIWPSANFEGKSLRLTVPAGDCHGGAFKLILAHLTQDKTLKVDSNLTGEQKSPVYSRSGLQSILDMVTNTLGSEAMSEIISNYECPLGSNGSRYNHYGDNTLTGEDMRTVLKNCGLTMSGTKEIQSRRLAEHYGKLYESLSLRDKIAGIIPFDNLVIFNDTQGRYGSALSDSAMDDLSCMNFTNEFVFNKNFRESYTVHGNLGAGNEKLTEFFKLAVSTCEAFKCGIDDFLNICTVYIMEHTASGAIFRKSHKDSLRTPENLFYEMISKSQNTTHDWKGIQL